MPLKMLVAYSMESTFVQTTVDYLSALREFTGFEVDYLHVTHGANVEADLDRYDVILHNYCARLCVEGYVSETYRERIRRFDGLKVAVVQDEYNHTNVTKSAIRELGFDIVLSCVPRDFMNYVYPSREFPGVRFVTVLAGYVADGLSARRTTIRPLEERPVVVGYRGRDLGAVYGRLGREKFEIGRRMKLVCDARGVPNDIAMDEKSRIYGPAWFEFIGNCRAMLGSESGSNVFDFDGSLERKYAEITRANGGVPPSFEEFSVFTEPREHEIEMGQVSPRIFECALMQTPMVLFRGRYSDVIRPDEHYIALEKDFSNVDAVLDRLRDIPVLKAMAERAYGHLVSSGRYSYRAFGAMLRDMFERALEEKTRCRGAMRTEVAAMPKSPTGRGIGVPGEVPTRLPKGRQELRERQLARIGVTTAAQMRKKAREYGRSMERHFAFATRHARFLAELDQRLSRLGGPTGSRREKDATDRLMAALHEARAAVKESRHTWRAEEVRAIRARESSDWAGAVAKDSATTEFKVWFGDYFVLYSAYLSALDEALMWLSPLIREKLKILAASIGRLDHVRLQFRWLLVRASAPRRAALGAVKKLANFLYARGG